MAVGTIVVLWDVVVVFVVFVARPLMVDCSVGIDSRAVADTTREMAAARESNMIPSWSWTLYRNPPAVPLYVYME